MLYLGIAMGVLVYLIIGKIIGEKKWEIVEKEKYSVISFLFFPYYHVTHQLGVVYDKSLGEKLLGYDDRISYGVSQSWVVGCHIFGWPLTFGLSVVAILWLPIHFLIHVRLPSEHGGGSND